MHPQAHPNRRQARVPRRSEGCLCQNPLRQDSLNNKPSSSMDIRVTNSWLMWSSAGSDKRMSNSKPCRPAAVVSRIPPVQETYRQPRRLQQAARWVHRSSSVEEIPDQHAGRQWSKLSTSILFPRCRFGPIQSSFCLSEGGRGKMSSEFKGAVSVDYERAWRRTYPQNNAEKRFR